MALLELIDALPTASRFRQAVLLDEECAAGLLAASQGEDEQERAWSPSIAEWGLTEELLASVYDRLGDVAQAVLSTIPVDRGKARPKYPGKEFPRAKTAIDAARERMALEMGHALLKAFFPHAT